MTKADDRKTRLAQALRANLKRRKAHPRGPDDPPGEQPRAAAPAPPDGR